VKRSWSVMATAAVSVPERRRYAVIHARQAHGMSERLACRVVKQPRGTQRYRPTQRDDEDALTQAIVTLAAQYGRYGYRRITALLKRTGWRVGKTGLNGSGSCPGKPNTSSVMISCASSEQARERYSTHRSPAHRERRQILCQRGPVIRIDEDLHEAGFASFPLLARFILFFV
jgi:hypothetical protein